MTIIVIMFYQSSYTELLQGQSLLHMIILKPLYRFVILIELLKKK